MYTKLILGAWLAGLHLTAANAPEHHKSYHDKTVWVTEIRTVRVNPSVPSSWADGFEDGWNKNGGKDKHNHQSSKDPHHDGKFKLDTHETEHKPTHPKPTHDSQVKNEHPKAQHSKDHENEHPEHKPSKPKQHQPDQTQHRAQGAAPSYTGDTLNPPYKKQVVHNHNVHRGNHSAPQIAWSDSLAATAAKIASSCVFAHSMGVDGGGYGQNIAAGASDGAISHVISDQFYNAEINNFGNQYGVADPSGFESWGHFSQLVWKNTAHVGCATQYCPGGVQNTGSNVPPYFTVCNYSPPGNVANQYAQNIGQPVGKPTLRGHGVRAKHD